MHAANGFGAVALSALLCEDGFAAPVGASNDPAAARPSHLAARAKHVIFLYMDGGPSQVDTFDPKPRLDRENGQPFKMKVQPTQFDNVGTTLKSPWKFRKRGASGIDVSDLLPHIARCADELCVVRSMTSQFSEHTNANYFLHTGLGLQGRPSMGAWVTYGLGSESRDLPGFIVLNGDLIPPGGVECFHNGFLPATFQGSVFRRGANPVADLAARERSASTQRRKLDLMRTLDAASLERSGHNDAIEAAIRNYELAFRMQTAVPELMDVSRESKATQELYGMFDPYDKTRSYAHQCLVARRLVERGVRFIELTCPQVPADRWDQHSRLKRGAHAQRAGDRQADRRPVNRPQVAGPAGRNAGDLGGRIRPHADGPGKRRPRPQSVRLHDLDGRRRREAGLRLRRDRRVRLLRDREQARNLRPARDDVAISWASTTSGSPSASARATCGSPTSTARSRMS